MGKLGCLPKPKCLNELFQKIRGRRHDDDEDEGMPRSPVSQSTADVIENGLKGKSGKSMNRSNHSLASMDSSDNELDDDIDGVKWTSAVSLSKSQLASLGPLDNVDLDIVQSSGNLNSSAAQHKIAIKQKNKRASSRFQRQPKSRPTAPSPLTIPEVKEESPPPDDTAKLVTLQKSPMVPKKPAAKEVKVEQTVAVIETHNSHSTPVSNRKSVEKRKSTEIKPAVEESNPKEDLIETKEVDETENDQNEKDKSETGGHQKEETVATVEKTKDPGFTGGTVEKAGSIKDKDSKLNSKPAIKSPKPVTTTNTEYQGVVLRKTVKNTNEEDSKNDVQEKKESILKEELPTKRIDTSIFGERKISKRVSSYEPKKWEDLEKNTDTVKSVDAEEGGVSSGGSEFSAVFNKLKRHSSQKKSVLEEEDKEQQKNANVVASSTSVKQLKSMMDKDTENKTSSVTTKPPMKTASFKKDQSDKDKKATEPAIKQTKAETEAKTKTESDVKSDSIEKSIPSSQVSSEKQNSRRSFTSDSRVEDDLAPRANKVKNEAVVEKLDTEKKTNVKSSLSSSKSDKVKNNLDDSPSNKDENENEKAVFKRESPLLKNRERSKTVPGKSDSKPDEKMDEDDVAAMNAYKNVERRSSVVQASTRNLVQPKKLLIEEKGPDDPPPWVALARRKTKQWGKKDGEDSSENAKEDKENEKEQIGENQSDSEEKKPGVSQNCGSAASNRQSKVLDLMKNFQKAS